jgi:hypothetical protein
MAVWIQYVGYPAVQVPTSKLVRNNQLTVVRLLYFSSMTANFNNFNGFRGNML